MVSRPTVMLHYIRKNSRALTIAATALAACYLALSVILREQISTSYNLVSTLPWIQVSTLGGVIVAASTIINVRRREEAQEALWRTTPRSIPILRVIDSITIYVSVIFVPLTSVYALTFAYSAVASNQGHLDFGFLLSALVFGAVLVLIGESVAALISIRLVAVLVGFVLGVVVGNYATVPEGALNNWDSFDSQNYLSTIPWIIILLFLKVMIDREEGQPRRLSSSIAISTILVIAFVGFYLLSPALLYKDREATASQYSCATIAGNELCTWNESDYKIPTMEMQLKRASDLLRLLGTSDPMITAAEPGLAGAATQNFSVESEVVTLPFTGGDKNSWAAAQTLAFSIFDRSGIDYELCPDNNETTWDLLAIVSNYIYGDISYSGYKSQDPKADKRVEVFTSKWRGLEDSDIALRISQILETYAQTCAVEELK